MSPEQRKQVEEELFLLKQLLEFHTRYEAEIRTTTMTPEEHVNYRISIMAEIYRLQQLVQDDE